MFFLLLEASELNTLESSVLAICAGVPISCLAPFTPEKKYCDLLETLPEAKPPLNVGLPVAAGNDCGPGFVTFRVVLIGNWLSGFEDHVAAVPGPGEDVLSPLAVAAADDAATALGAMTGTEAVVVGCVTVCVAGWVKASGAFFIRTQLGPVAHFCLRLLLRSGTCLTW